MYKYRHEITLYNPGADRNEKWLIFCNDATTVNSYESFFNLIKNNYPNIDIYNINEEIIDEPFTYQELLESYYQVDCYIDKVTDKSDPSAINIDISTATPDDTGLHLRLWIENDNYGDNYEDIQDTVTDISSTKLYSHLLKFEADIESEHMEQSVEVITGRSTPYALSEIKTCMSDIIALGLSTYLVEDSFITTEDMVNKELKQNVFLYYSYSKDFDDGSQEWIMNNDAIEFYTYRTEIHEDDLSDVGFHISSHQEDVPFGEYINGGRPEDLGVTYTDTVTEV